jgi:predicted DNA-binding transcriptional regulator AlpA
MDVDDQFLSRKNLLGEFGISDSSERRRRKCDENWPAHVRIGRKVYYRRSAIEDWLRRQEASCRAGQLGFGARRVDDATMSALRRHAKELAEEASPAESAADRLHEVPARLPGGGERG